MKNENPRKTKILCTLGPATNTEKDIESLIEHGMNVARINFSHANQDEHLARIKQIRDVENKLDIKIPIILDTKGPEIRLGHFENPVTLNKGQEFILTTREVEGTDKIATVSHKNITKDAVVGKIIELDDGLVELKIIKVEEEDVICEVLVSGEISTNKNVILQNVKVSIPILSDKDVSDLKFGCENKVDFIGASFIRKKEDVLLVRNYLKQFGDPDIQVISKIANQEAVDNFDEILEASDGIMIARGDLGTEIPIQKVPVYQKMMLKKCIERGKFSITATHMLDSMNYNPRPTRAEVTDVANAILDGTTAVMLSAETASGKYPIQACKFMNDIAYETEKNLNVEKLRKSPCSVSPDDDIMSDNFRENLHYSNAITANLLHADAIICVTRNGHSAENLSKFRPNCPIFAICDHEYVARQLAIRWGVTAYFNPKLRDFSDLLYSGIDHFLKKGFLKKGDLVVVAGSPKNIEYALRTNQNVGGILKV